MKKSGFTERIMKNENRNTERRNYQDCFRVLRNDGVLVFKWNSEQIPFADVVKLSPYKPIFGDKRAKTRWKVFVKNAALRKGEKA